MDFTHIDKEGRVRMVDVSGKPIVKRTAVATGNIHMNPDTIARLRDGLLEKGDAIATARIAGIMAAKKTGQLIPLCHPLPIDDVQVDFDIGADDIGIRAQVISTARTGVEMEALTAVSLAALSLYDMCKAIDKGMSIGEIKLESKRKEPA